MVAKNQLVAIMIDNVITAEEAQQKIANTDKKINKHKAHDHFVRDSLSHRIIAEEFFKMNLHEKPNNLSIGRR